MNNVTQDMKYRQSLVSFALKYGVSRASRKYNKPVPQSIFGYQGTMALLNHCPAGHESRIHIQINIQYTAIDEFSRLRYMEAFDEQSTYSSATFLKNAAKHFRFPIECVQTDNGFEFTNRFSASNRNLPTLFEATAASLGFRHKLIRPYTPRHNGKVERSHREDQKRFYSKCTFYSFADFKHQLEVHRLHCM